MATVHATFEENDQFLIPEWVRDNASFLRWAESDDAPQRGRIGYFQGTVWIDTTMEQIFHNEIKAAVTETLRRWTREQDLGTYHTDGVLLTCPEVELSTEPDGLFVSKETKRSGQIVYEEEKRSSKVVGVPDMVLEVISRSSVTKDLKTLRLLYHEAGLQEYWLIDSRVDEPQLSILRHTASGYKQVPARDGWSRSKVFKAEFKLSFDETGTAAVLKQR
jgi:Uma2 family endonuclease